MDAHGHHVSQAVKLIAMSEGATPQCAADEFRRCVRERMRLAREVAGLRAAFATAVEHYERVVRTMTALAPSLGIEKGDIGHPTDPEWGPIALFAYGEDRFTKHEQESANRVLKQLP